MFESGNLNILYRVAVATPRDLETNWERTLRSGHLGEGVVSRGRVWLVGVEKLIEHSISGSGLDWS